MVRQINVLTYPSPSPSPPFRRRGDLFRASSMRGLTDSASSICYWLRTHFTFHFTFRVAADGRSPMGGWAGLCYRSGPDIKVLRRSPPYQETVRHVCTYQKGEETLDPVFVRCRPEPETRHAEGSDPPLRGVHPGRPGRARRGAEPDQPSRPEARSARGGRHAAGADHGGGPGQRHVCHGWAGYSGWGRSADLWLRLRPGHKHGVA